MNPLKRTFSDLSFEEKLTIIDDYLDSLNQTDNYSMLAERMEWLRRHIPTYNGNLLDNYVFISYSHKDFKQVYSDLAFFSYNNRKRVRFWYDEGLPAGDDWFSVAKERLSDPHCVGVIFYLSENFLRSPAVLKEIELVKSLRKSYFTISLEPNKFCAQDYLDPQKDKELLSKVDAMFPRDDTAVSYGVSLEELFPNDGDAAQEEGSYDERYENAIYRIRKIEQAFGVVEEIFSDFVFEQMQDGLCLTEYRGYETEVHLPARIGKQPLVEIKAHFKNATKIFIPATVQRIFPVEIPEENNGFDADDQNTWSLESVYLMQIGGYQSPGAIFGKAPNLTHIYVDSQNPIYYDREGILYDRQNTLVRVPANHPWDDTYAEEIHTVGVGAFYGYQISDANITLPETATRIEANAFAFANVFYISADFVKEVGNGAFAYCSMMQGMLPFSLPDTLEKLGEFAFYHTNVAFISISGSTLEEIRRGTFFGYGGDYIGIPQSVKIIQHGAFALCPNLQSITLPEGVLGIGDYAFAECQKLYSIRLPRSITYLSPIAFDTENILRYMLYKGNSRDYYYLRRTNDLEDAKYLPLIINRDQWLARMQAGVTISVRNYATKLLEKLQTPKSNSGKKPGVLKGITLPMILSFLICAALLFFADYRRLVLEISPDWIYWLSAGVGFVLSYSGSRHLYWTRIVGKHKKNAQNKEKPQKDFTDAWTSVLALGFVAYAALSVLITVIISGLFNLPTLANLFAGLGG